MSNPDDPYSRVDYRRLIAWPERIRREAPFLRRVLAGAPLRRVVDLGCGTGEHARFLAGEGFSAIGLDRSEEMLARAREEDPEGIVTWILGDLADLEPVLEAPVGGALCLGNALPHLTSQTELSSMLAGLASRLAEGSPVVLQILNYERIFARNERTLPVNVRDVDGDTVVFLRLMTPGEGGCLWFNPTSLRYRPGAEPPVEIVSTRNVSLRGWRAPELESALAAHGLRVEDRFGGMQEEPYDPAESRDLVLVARRVRNRPGG